MPKNAHPPDAEKIMQQFKEFAYIVSHDLNTPLRAIVEFSKLLKAEQQDVLNDEGKEYLSLIVESGEKLQAMLAGLLDFSRLNTMSKPFSKTNCTTVLNDCAVVLKDKITATKAKLDIGPLPTIQVDAEQLMQLFLILLENALKFHVAGNAPQISVSAEKKENEWVFSVRDNGIGIEPEFHNRIFQPFQRLHIEGEYPGIGIGLTLAKKIVDRHDGRIWIESGSGKGAAFMFALPQHEAS